jgi:gluconate/galactonate dehydratase
MMNRRKFMGISGLSAAAFFTDSKILKAVPNAEMDLGKVKITDVKTAAIKVKKYTTHLVKVETDSGLFGLGESYPKSEVADDIKDIKRKIIGMDPLQVEVLHQKMTDSYISRGSLTGSLCGAISGI